jgi:hypothetical protein
VIVELKELNAAQARGMLEVILGIVRDQVALARHFENKNNYAAVPASEADAYEHIAKYLLAYFPELKNPPGK